MTKGLTPRQVSRLAGLLARLTSQLEQAGQDG